MKYLLKLIMRCYEMIWYDMIWLASDVVMWLIAQEEISQKESKSACDIVGIWGAIVLFWSSLTYINIRTPSSSSCAFS